LGIPVVIIVWIIRVFTRRNKNINRMAGFHTATEIEKLFTLKEKGAITEKEFNDRKSKLLT
jgi:uncharacterized membrane protein